MFGHHHGLCLAPKQTHPLHYGNILHEMDCQCCNIVNKGTNQYTLKLYISIFFRSDDFSNHSWRLEHAALLSDFSFLL